MSGKAITVNFKVIRAERRTTKTHDPYYILELLDETGKTYEARIWNDALAGRGENHLPQEGWYLGDVKSHENIFKGQRQLVIDDYWILEPDEVHEAIKEQFVEQPVIDVDRVIDRMFNWTFWDNDIRILMKRVEEHLKKDGVWDKIKAIPAGASYHHSVRGGFLLHVDEMLNFSERICNVSVYGRSIIDPDYSPEHKHEVVYVNGIDHYPGLIDYQILRAAIVLHDIGKLYDYSEKTLQYESNSISECLEHTLVGILMVERYWVNGSLEAIDRGLRLMHALAAHHGPEMGVVKPKTPEAIVLHHLDMLSAHLDVCRRAYHDAKKSGTSGEYSRMLGVRPFIPGFFPPDTLVYPRNEELDQIVIEKTEFVSEGTEKLPWEE